ncbi:unnamed protein product [Rotaria sordida]|uniref:FAD-binding PCMH-type domain-containing protein n=1 Tax=Rotaria sordida TaxID=392033 RepID=A0A813V416_9BILA|nr:unnamed protein product [Rotaria sordida]CAF0870607.1 unnamed protein product [Rotaria sordida]
MNACKSIADNISAHSKVFYPFDLEYYESIKHYAATSTIFSVCSVEPNNAADVAIIIKIIRQGQVQFAIKGGGHAMNPGFSSTTGIHIAMRRFDTITYHPNNQTVDVGPGLVWDDVYRALAPYNVTVIGGRFSSVGVAGLILGGGYSWKSNQFGLSIDNVFEYEDGILGMDLVVFYDAPVAPDGIFKEFTDLHPIGILHSRSLLSIVQCTPGFLTDNLRGHIEAHDKNAKEALIKLAQQAKPIEMKGNNIAFFGLTSTGESTMLDSLLGEKKAATDVGETTLEVTPYSGRNFVLWDIPSRNDEVSYMSMQYISFFKGLTRRLIFL